MNTVIQCEEVSPRSEISGRVVCTKMVLYLRENHTPLHRAKVVLHFYHTSNSVQVQGSQVMSTGVSSPVWLVTHFLEPLASSHATQHATAIDAINDHIQTRVFQCRSCKLPLNPAASNPKDQQLACNKCQNLFHKKCTDRRKTTANWRKKPLVLCRMLNWSTSLYPHLSLFLFRRQPCTSEPNSYCLYSCTDAAHR